MEEYLDVRCAIHGPMKHRFAPYWWECVGFDGEGCDSLFTDEAAYDVMHGGPIRDTRCLPTQWHINSVTGMMEVVVGGTDAKTPDAHVVQD